MFIVEYTLIIVQWLIDRGEDAEAIREAGGEARLRDLAENSLDDGERWYARLCLVSMQAVLARDADRLGGYADDAPIMEPLPVCPPSDHRTSVGERRYPIGGRLLCKPDDESGWCRPLSSATAILILLLIVTMAAARCASGRHTKCTLSGAGALRWSVSDDDYKEAPDDGPPPVLSEVQSSSSPAYWATSRLSNGSLLVVLGICLAAKATLHLSLPHVRRIRSKCSRRCSHSRPATRKGRRRSIIDPQPRF